MVNIQQKFINDIVKQKESDMVGFIKEKNVDNFSEVHWLDYSSSLENDDVLITCGRLFSCQDRVASASEPTGQTGYVTKINLYVDLLGSDGTLIKNVSTRDLKCVREPAFGMWVVLGPWLGMIEDVWDDVTLLVGLDLVVVPKVCYEYLEGVHISELDDVLQPHYPGEVINVGASEKWKDVLDAYGQEANAIVTKVTPCEVLIEWIATQQSSSSKPGDLQIPSILKILRTFDHEKWGLGHRCHLSSQFDANSRLVEKEKAFRIVNMWEIVDVLWQNGIVELGKVSTSLIAIANPGDYEFLPDEYVMEKTFDESLGSGRVGVIRKVNSNERTALVRWLIPSSAEDESVSVYELRKSNEHQLDIGNFVRKKSTNYVGPAWIGQVTGYSNGEIEVSWVDETVSMVGLEDIYYIPTRFDRFVPDPNEGGDHIGIFDPIADDELASGAIEAGDGDDISVFDPIADDELASGAIESGDDDTVVAKALCYDDVSGFKLFDASTDPSDNHYFGESYTGKRDRKWLKKVQKEWKILENSLPDEIYTRIYEDRMDLLRAVIIGPYGTPYHDGLFFFDLHLRPNYPDVPPLVYYHSGGLQINANLNKNGSVCLSLLNTWLGSQNEVWNPESSTILQVLVSLQALVLNAKPYFNEAGYDSKIGTAVGEKNSLAYNETTFLMNCHRMLALIRAPPKGGFEELVKEHFKRRGYCILKACDAYKKGCLVGSLTKDASTSDNINSDLTSTTGFKATLDKILPKLYTALNEIGADCTSFKHLITNSE